MAAIFISRRHTITNERIYSLLLCQEEDSKKKKKGRSKRIWHKHTVHTKQTQVVVDIFRGSFYDFEEILFRGRSFAYD